MANFHIYPADPLAMQAAVEVQEVVAENPDAVVCIRGQRNENGDEWVYTVALAPHDWTCDGYLWEYTSAAEWLREYKAMGR